MTKYLSDPDRTRLFSTIQNHGFLDDGRWDVALAELDPGYRALLGDDANPGPRLMKTLITLNRTGRLFDGTVPLEVVLASLKLQTREVTIADVFAELLAKVQGQVGMGAPPGSVRYDPAQPEAYVGASDDMLPFDFMWKGHIAGRAVVRILVPRFDNGQRAIASDGPRIYVGTGWLAAHDLFLTNLHVICARESSEPDPSPADLALQISNATIELDYDSESAHSRGLPVLECVAHGAVNGHLDYAVLRVAPSGEWPKPLRLRREVPFISPQGYAVNIIQHPQGWPKRVATRNNLMKTATATLLEYFSDTLGGSSGSPLCNDAWEVIGLHRAAGPATNVIIKGRTAAAYNIGIPMYAILDDLKQNHGRVFDAFAPHVVP